MHIRINMRGDGETYGGEGGVGRGEEVGGGEGGEAGDVDAEREDCPALRTSAPVPPRAEPSRRGELTLAGAEGEEGGEDERAHRDFSLVL